METYQFQIILRLILAVILGGILGFEREKSGKEAGLRTYILVILGSCIFTIASTDAYYLFSGRPEISFDPSRIVLAVATGIGFIGAGAIIQKQSHIEGLTTAAELWAAAAIGVAIGLRLNFLAVTATILIVLVLVAFRLIEKRFLKKDR